MTVPAAAPRAFISYAWDDAEHEAWVLQLATRLRSNGVDAVLDKWDTRLGSDLSLFMESGISSADRVIVVSSDQYVNNSNAPTGGVGYEKRLLTPRLMQNLESNLVIPIVRNRTSSPKLPRFLGSSKYVDFSDPSKYEEKYAELIHDIHGRQIQPVPPLGFSPFDQMPAEEVAGSLRNEPARYVSPASEGWVEFDYTNNSGNYVVGAGDMRFTVSLSTAGYGSIHLYNDPGDIAAIALAVDVNSFEEIGDARQYDSSSRSRTVRVGDGAILRNAFGYYAALLIDNVVTRETSADGKHKISFRYRIQTNRASVFS